jgi:hypothetical protein
MHDTMKKPRHKTPSVSKRARSTSGARAEHERSMSRKRNPWDNAVIESFFSTLRFELLCRTRFADPDEAERGISEWVERFYNLHRRHTTLGSVSPINYKMVDEYGSRGHTHSVHGIGAGSSSIGAAVDQLQFCGGECADKGFVAVVIARSVAVLLGVLDTVTILPSRGGTWA